MNPPRDDLVLVNFICSTISQQANASGKTGEFSPEQRAEFAKVIRQLNQAVKHAAEMDTWWQLKYFWNVHPETWGKISPQFDHCASIFQMGWFNQPTAKRQPGYDREYRVDSKASTFEESFCTSSGQFDDVRAHFDGTKQASRMEGEEFLEE